MDQFLIALFFQQSNTCTYEADNAGYVANLAKSANGITRLLHKDQQVLTTKESPT